jgi:hypothetical protein
MKPFSFVVTFVIFFSGFYAWRSLENHTPQDIAEHKTEMNNILIHSGSWSSLYTVLLSLIVFAAKNSDGSSSGSSGSDSGFDISDITDLFGGNDD